MLLIYLGLGWLAGLWLAAQLDLNLSIWLTIAAFSAVTAFLVRLSDRKGTPFILLATLAAACLAGARYELAQPHIDADHIAYYNDSGVIQLIGLVTGEPDVGDRSVRLQFQAERLILEDGTEVEVTGRVQVVTFRFPVIPYGARLQLQGKLETPPSDESFDYRAFLARRNIHSLLERPRVTVMAQGEGNRITHFLLAFKAHARTTVRRLLSDPQGALLTAVLLGDDSGLAPDLVERFRRAGVAHITVVSGFHIAILTGVLLQISRPWLGRRGAVWFTLAALLIYTLLVGAGPSVLRAAIMGGGYLLASGVMGRPNFRYGSLMLAAVLITAMTPLALWEIGFQLSFAATLGLMLYAGRFDRWAESQLARVASPRIVDAFMSLFVRVVLVSLAAQLLTLPLIMHSFEQVSLISPLTNALIGPAQPPLMMFGALATLLGMIVPVLGQLVAWIDWLFLSYTVGVVKTLGGLPLAAVPVQFSTMAVLLSYGVIAAVTWLVTRAPEQRATLLGRLSHNLSPRAATAVALVAATLTMGYAHSQPDGRLHVAFMDVGQGDAIFIQTPDGRQLLVDGGLYPTILNQRLGEQMPFWDKQIDIVVATHPDADHVAGIPGVFERYQVGQMITDGTPEGTAVYETLLQAASAAGTPIHHAQAGEQWDLGDGVRLEFIHPGRQRNEDSANDNSVSFRLTYDNFSLLLTGDAEEWGEQVMLDSGLPLPSVVFKAGHHGSRTSSNASFLAAVQPQIIVVSAGRDNRFGHPHEEVLQRAAAAGAAVLRTDQLGTLEITTDGAHMWWEARGP